MIADAVVGGMAAQILFGETVVVVVVMIGDGDRMAAESSDLGSDLGSDSMIADVRLVDYVCTDMSD